MKKMIFFMVLGGLAFGAKYLLFDFAVSTGKRVGNLVKISKKGRLLKTWEGTIDEGSGDKLTSYFSVSNEKLGKELYEYEGKQVVIYYVEHLMAFPYDTKYDVLSWKPRDQVGKTNSQAISEPSFDMALLQQVNKNLFCSFLGALKTNRSLYIQVKNFIKKNNHYLFQQYQRCNH